MSDQRDQRREFGTRQRPVCKHFSASGTCPKRNECIFQHIQPSSSSSSSQPSSRPEFRGGRSGGNYRQGNWNSSDSNERQGGYSQSRSYNSKQMMGNVVPLELQFLAMQQQQMAGQMNFLQTLLMHKFSVAINSLLPQIEQIIDKSKNAEQFKTAESFNRQGNPTGAAEILCQILKETDDQEKEEELVAEIEKAHKEATNIDQAQISTLLTGYGMSAIDIQQISLFYVQNLQMLTVQQQQQAQQMMQFNIGDQASEQS